MREENSNAAANSEVTMALYQLLNNGLPVTREMIKQEVKMGNQRFKTAFDLLLQSGTIEPFAITDVDERKRLNLNNRQSVFYRLRKNWIPT